MLEAQLSSFLVVDTKSKIIISPDKKDEAMIISAEIKVLREKNENNAKLLEKAKEISKKYNIELDELHQLHLSIPHLEKQVNELSGLIAHHKALDPKRYEIEKTSKFSPLFQEIKMLEAARESLKNHQAARNELKGGK
jgi:hypothetical protein